jgi:hypothetical protein
MRGHALLGGGDELDRLLEAQRCQALRLNRLRALPCVLPCVGGLRAGVNALDNDLLAPAENLNLVAKTVR